MTCGSDEIMWMRCHTGCAPLEEPPAALLPPSLRLSVELLLLLLPLLPLLLLRPVPVWNRWGGCCGSCSRMWYACFLFCGGGGISTRALQRHSDARC